MTKSLLIHVAVPLLILLLPFAVLYWLNPLTSDQTIGNDYVTFAIDHQLALQYSIERGSFPLYAPGFAGGGHSSAALTLGQLHHPIAHIAARLPGYWEGNALQANTVLRLISIGLTHLVLLILLLKLRLPIPAAFAISFITVYNLRMLDMFRYGASLENYLAFLLLSAALSFDYLKPTRIRGPAFLVVATYLLVCGGHPQIMYLGLLGAVGVALVLPFALSAVLQEATPPRARLKSFYLRAAAFVGVGITMSSAYILPFYFEFIRGNAARVDRNYSWSLGYSDSWGGVFNSFFRPLHADVHGAFGSSAIILLVLLIPAVLLFVKRPPKILFVLFGAALTVFLISLGRATPLHYLFWRFVPLFDSFRTPGRINLILPFVFLLLLAWWLKNSAVLSFRRPRWSRISPCTAVSVLSILVYLVYNIWLIHVVPKPAHYTPVEVNRHPFVVQEIAYWLGLSTLVLLGLYTYFSTTRILKAVLGGLLCLAVILQCGTELRFGTWMTSERKKPTLGETDKKMAKRLAVLGLTGFGMEAGPVAEQMKQSALETKVARFFRTYRTAASPEEAYNILAEIPRNGTPVAVTDKRPKPKADCSYDDKNCKPDVIQMRDAAYNRVAFDVTATEDGLFTLSVPFFPNWRAFLDDMPVPSIRAEGYMVGVFVPEGRHRVAFQFSGTTSLVGFGLFSAVLIGMAVFFSFGFPALKWKIPLIGFGVLVGVSLFLWPYRSLYTGDNLKTQYRWTSKELPNPKNLALYKKAEMSSIKSNERIYDFYAGRAVDGDRATAFTTAPGKLNPWWQVDLGALHTLSEVVIYEMPSAPIRSHLPLQIKISSNGKSFKDGVTVSTTSRDNPLRIDMQGIRTRFVRIQSKKTPSLSFKEVEVFKKP